MYVMGAFGARGVKFAVRSLSCASTPTARRKAKTRDDLAHLLPLHMRGSAHGGRLPPAVRSLVRETTDPTGHLAILMADNGLGDLDDQRTAGA